MGRLVVAMFFVAPAALGALALAARTARVVESYEVVMERAAVHLDAAREASVSENVDPTLLLAVACAESAGRAGARSSAGAVGLMQLMPSTADEAAAALSEPRPDLTDPATSLRLGARYLRRQLDRFESSPCARELALCAYNAGPEKVQAWLDAGPPPTPENVIAWIPYSETRAFVRRVIEYHDRWTRRAAAAAR